MLLEKAWVDMLLEFLDGVWKKVFLIGMLPIAGMRIGVIKDSLKLKEEAMSAE